VVFLLCLLAYLCVAFLDAASIDLTSDRIFPMTVAAVGIVGSVALLVKMIRTPEPHVLFADREAAGEDAEAPHGLWATLSWLALLLTLSALVGFIMAAVVFMLSFLRIRAGVSWRRALVLTTLGIAFLCFVAGTLNRDFPPGLLQEYMSLPWPLT